MADHNGVLSLRNAFDGFLSKFFTIFSWQVAMAEHNNICSNCRI